MNVKNLPAFPVEVSVDGNGNLRGSQTSNFSGFEMGLTKREYFAGLAMQGLLNNYAQNLQYGNHVDYPMVSEIAVRCADDLLNELEKAK